MKKKNKAKPISGETKDALGGLLSRAQNRVREITESGKLARTISNRELICMAMGYVAGALGAEREVFRKSWEKNSRADARMAEAGYAHALAELSTAKEILGIK